MLVFLFIPLASLRRVLAVCDNSKVVVFPVQDVLLSNGENMRGIPLSAGTPPQAFSLLPQPFYNDTWLYNTTSTFCSDFGDLQTNGCITQRGGLYDWSSSSSSATPPTDVYSAGGDPGDTTDVIGQEVTGSSFIKDTLVLPNSTSLSGYPIGMPGLSLNTFYNTQGALGIGPNSTMLSTLVAAGKIASRSFSWWWGLTGATKPAQMDGQFILGGYDKAKIQGRSYTQSLAPPSQACHSGMVVTISDLVLQFPNGTSSSFLTPNILTTCILPEYPLMVYFPWVPHFLTFEALTSTSNLGHGGGNGLTFEGMLYPLDNVFDGGLTITLNDDFEVTFPNDLLVVPPTSVRPDGSIFKNHSVAEVLFNPTAGGRITDYAILGRDFFQAAYLTVDYDANTFTISQANAVTDSNIVSLEKHCSSLPSGSPSNQVGPGTSTTPASEPTGHSTGSHKGSSGSSSLSTGEIIGAAVGSVCFVVLIAIIAAILCFQQRKAAHGKVNDGRSRKTFVGQGSDHETAAIRRNSNAGVPEAMSKDIVEMQSRRSQAELDAWTKPTELRNNHTSRAHRQSLWPNSPIELE